MTDKKSLSVTIVLLLAISISMIPTIGIDGQSESTTRDTFHHTLNELTTDDLKIIKSEDIYSANSVEKDILVKDIKNGTPLIVMGDSTAVQQLGISVVVNPEDPIIAIYCDPLNVTTYCFSGDTMDETVDWINSVQQKTSSNKQSSETRTDYNDVLIYEDSETFSSGKAKMNVQATYSKIGTSNSRTYYSVEYLVESFVYDDEWHTSKITVESDISGNNQFQQLHDYGPLTTMLDTEETVEVGVSLSLPISIGINYSKSWTYTIPQMSVQDNCDIDEDYFEIIHDVVNDNSMPKVTVKPGSIVSVASSSIYDCEDVFTVSYYKPYYEHLWPWDPYMEHDSFTITCPILIDPQP